MKAAVIGTGFMGAVHGQAIQTNGIELVGFALVPLLATLMARGVGLPA